MAKSETSNRCPRCNGPRGDSAHKTYCTPCIVAYRKDWYANNTQKVKDAAARNRAAARDADPKLAWAKLVVGTARRRAAKLNIPFNLTAEYVASIAEDVCPVFGLQLRYPSAEDVYTPHKVYPNSPSLDQVTARQGYVRGNVSVISYRANTIKNAGTAEEHRKIADWLDQQLHQSSQQET